MCFIMKGTWVSENTTARISSPGKRKATQTASGWVSQTNRLSSAMAMKKPA